MLKRKYMIMGFLAFCLTTTLFIGITSSGNQSTASVGEYDPWADINSDGIVDIVDIVSVALSFGSSGDPTRNVTVTNLPLDEQGNLKTTIIEEKTFPEILVLKGEVLTTGETILLPYETPSPYVINPQPNRYDFRFIYEVYPQKSYKIHGVVIVALRYEYVGNGAGVSGTLYFEKILSNGSIVTLANRTMPTVPQNEEVKTSLTFSFETPITIATNERIAIRTYFVKSGAGDFYLYCDTYLKVMIPIIT